MSARAFVRRAASFAVAVSALCHTAPVQPAAGDEPEMVFRTVAGGGAGEGGPATDAAVVAPARVAATETGFLVAQPGAFRVRRVDGKGILRSYAGNGVEGLTGDGGPATDASLAGLLGVAVDATGRGYLVDQANGRIRRVDVNGVVTTFAGGGTASEDDESGDVGDGGPARNAVLSDPSDVAVAPDGTVYVADTGHARVRRIDTQGKISTMLRGETEEGVEVQPSAVAVGRNGEVYVADADGATVYRIGSGGTAVILAGDGTPGYGGDGGPATAAQLSNPTDLAVDSRGGLLVADSGNHRIRRISGGVITTFAGPAATACDDAEACGPGYDGDGGPALGARLSSPSGLSVDPDGNVYVADTGNNRIRRIGRDGTIRTVAGNGTGFAGDGRPARHAALGAPAGLAADGTGTVYVADAAHHRVRAIEDGVITTVVGDGALTCTGEGADRQCTGAFSGDGGPATEAALNGPTAITLGASGTLYVADTANHVIRRRNPDGTIGTVAGNRANGADGTCPDALAKEIAAEGGPANAACLSRPGGVAVDSAGNLFIADTGNNRICKVTPAGVLTTVAGGAVGASTRTAVPGSVVAPSRLAALLEPRGLLLTGTGTTLLVADSGHNRVVSVDLTNGAITVYAGTGTAGATGDGAQANAATLTRPTALASDGSNNVYIADTGNDRIRKVAPGGVISTAVGGGSADGSSLFGDGGDPTSAVLSGPTGVVSADGRIYVSDTGRARVRGMAPPIPASRLSLTVSDASISAGETITLRGALTRADSGAALSGAAVAVRALQTGATDVDLTATTDTAGRFSLRLKPSRRTVYMADVEETEAHGGSSDVTTVTVRYAPTVSNPRQSSVTVRNGTVVSVTGSVVPATPNVRVELVRVVGSTRTVLVAARSRSDGRFTLSVKPKRATYTLRVRVPASAGNEAGESRSWTLRVT